MKNFTTIAGKIIAMKSTDTQYGRRTEAVLEQVDYSTGEVTEPHVLAWGEEAISLENEGLGGDVGLTGYWKKDDNGKPLQFAVRQVSQLRIVDPATVDVSAYI